MPALPSFITYKPGRKARAAIKSPFSLLRGESSSSIATASPLQNFITTDVIDINDHAARYSLDFDGGKPIDKYEKPIVDEEPLYQRAVTASPQVRLDIDFSRGTLRDAFPANFLQPEGSNATDGPKASGSAHRNEVTNISASTASLGLEDGEKKGSAMGDDNEDEDNESLSASSSEDVLASLRAMDPSHFGNLPGSDNSNRLEPSLSPPPKKKNPNATPKSQLMRPINTTPLSILLNQPMTPLDSPVSSAVSGTTIARHLMANAFSLTSDSRSSRYRSGVVGLTRSDSATLPRSEHSFGAAFSNDRFSIGSDAPPIPSNASSLYEPPKKPRTRAAELREKRNQNMRRRSSTGSLAVKSLRSLPDTPTSTRPSSLLLSPEVEFDLNSLAPIPRSPEFRKPSPLPRSPLPPTPKLEFLLEDDKSSEHGPDQYQEVTQPLPIGPQLLSHDSGTSSPTTSIGLHSDRNLEDVLNYYSLPDSPEPPPTNANYRPMFSPISEESSSQLSPPTPYRNEKRESQGNALTGVRSPLLGSPRVRGESVPLPRRPSDGRYSRQALVPLGERPISMSQLPAQLPSPSSIQSSSSLPSVASDVLLPFAPPQLSTIVNRQRSGSVPIPIRIVRDSSDSNAYNIVTSRLGGLGTPSAEQDVDDSQDFPETPNMFSPIFTADAIRSPFMGRRSFESVGGVDMSTMTTVPMSATLPRAQPTLAQQVLLNRTTGTAVTHPKQMNISRIQTNGLGGRWSPSNQTLPDISDTGLTMTTSNVGGSASSSSTGLNVQTDPLPEMFVSSTGHISAEDVVESPIALTTGGSIKTGISAVDFSRSPSRGTSVTHGSDAGSIYTSSSGRGRKSLPPIPVSPPVPTPTGSASVSPVPPPSLQSSMTGVATENHSSGMSALAPAPLPMILTTTNATPRMPPSLLPPPSPTSPQNARLPVRVTPPALTITSSVSPSAVAVNGDPNEESQPVSLGEPSTSAGRPAGEPNDNASASASVQNQTSHLTYKDNIYSGRASDIFRGTSLGSPPPYYSVVSEAIAQTAQHPSSHTSNPNLRTPAMLASFQFSGQPTGTTMPTTPGPGPLDPIPLSRENSTVQRLRMRPPLPAGPRRPSQMSASGSISGSLPLHFRRDRAGSSASVNSNSFSGNNHLLQAASRGREVAPTVSPKFQTPPPKWRGFTMEAAKWTFTSEQLQAIVSRAIRQSAEASSIRLLRLEVLDNEIPAEMQKLEAQETDLKMQYKMLARRRTMVVDALSTYMTHPDEESPAYALRLVEDLKEIAAKQDRLAEELHSVDRQLAHLHSMTQIHTGSALAMALRKLNSSFLKQVTENQMLRNQIQALEAERDEAWKQAEYVANECDRMNDRERADGPSSNRSSRISAVRKSTQRASKAGLRTPSQVSLSSSGMQSFGMTPSKSPLLRLDKPPPVPPIPTRRPQDILTDFSSRRSTTLSPLGVTPTSGTLLALAKAQDELYAMLGIANPERPLRRSLSATVLKSPPSDGSGHLTQQANLIPPIPRPLDDSRLSGGRSSLPGDSHLAEVYNAMAADRNAVLATIDMLSSEDRRS